MKRFLFYVIFLFTISAEAQNKPKTSLDSLNIPFIDSLIRQKLIELAMSNPALAEVDAQVNGSKYEVKRAKSSWLNTIVLSGNMNEFVVNNTTINGIPASTLYPKYNAGVNIPLGIFGRQEKNISREKLKMYEAQKESTKRELKKEVLTRYENYKEKKDLLDLQKQITDGQYGTYQQKQKEYASGDIQDVIEVNREYEAWMDHRSKQRTYEKELLLAEFELEEITGTRISEIIREVLNQK